MKKITRPADYIHLDPATFQRLRETDFDLFLEAKKQPCPRCGGKLDTSHYPRKPREADKQEDLRFSLCCRNEGCRHRVTPPSLRFLGRKVYSAWVVVLVLEFGAEMGLSREICRRTLSRWRQFWRERLNEAHSFMREARGLLPPGTPSVALPGALLACFGFPAQSSFVPLLRFFTQQPL